MIRKTQGGPDALQEMLRELKRFLFSGYVKIDDPAEDSRELGIIVLDSGAPSAVFSEALIEGEKTQFRGQAALKRLLVTTSEPRTLLEIHGKVDVGEIGEALKDSVITEDELAELGIQSTSVKKPASGPEERRVSLSWGSEDKKARFMKELERLKSDGFDTEDMASAAEKNPDSVDLLTRQVGETRALLRMLDSLESGGRVDEKREIRKRLLAFEDPKSLKKDIFDFQKRLREDSLAMKLEDQLSRDSEDKGRQKQVADIYGLIVKHQKHLHRAGAPVPEEDSLEEEEDAVDEPRPDTGLNREMTFEKFVTGPSNEFAVAASQMVAKSPSTEYNPLFITSGAGLGKTHLLNAIGNRAIRENPGIHVLYVTCERFTDELIRALRVGNLQEFRDGYRKIDVLLIDDVQFLAGKEKTQEEMFHTFNELYNSKKQIVAASDRPPKDIPTLGERLVSRFEAGVMADIQAPEFETRVAIAEVSAKEEGISLSREILQFLAEKSSSNVRELKGLIKRIAAFSSLMNTPVDIKLVDQMLQQKQASEAPAEVPVSPTEEVMGGISYLILEDKPSVCFDKAAAKARAGWQTLVVTRTNPNLVTGRHRELAKGEVLWLTDKETSKVKTVPPGLEKIMYLVEEFIKTADEGVVILDGLEYLISNNSFDAVLKFIRSIVDEVSESGSAFILSIGEATLNEQERKVLMRELESLEIKK